MCSIMGYSGSGISLELFKKGFEKTISRGPDASRIVDTGKGYLGFHRLAIMDLDMSGMQPFSCGKSFVVCNGEIYGFEKIKDKTIHLKIRRPERVSIYYTCRKSPFVNFEQIVNRLWR